MKSLRSAITSFASHWTSGMNVRGAATIIIPASLGAFIGMAVEYRVRQDSSVMDTVTGFLFFLELSIPNWGAALLVVCLAIALCFIFQMNSPLAALYGGASVITVLTTGLPPDRDLASALPAGQEEEDHSLNPVALVRPDGYVVEAVLRQPIRTGDGLLPIRNHLPAQINIPVIFCAHNQRPYRGRLQAEIDILGPDQFRDRERYEIAFRPPRHQQDFQFYVGDHTDGKHFEYRLSVSGKNLKTIKTNGSLRRSGLPAYIQVTLEKGKNNFFDWMLQPNVKKGNNQALLVCR